MATREQIEANRRNAKKGGPRTAEGKAVTSRNARKHGIFAAALTEFDAGELHHVHDELVSWLEPVGPLEAMLVEKLAHTYLRLQRCARAEAELHIQTWDPKWTPDGLPSFDLRGSDERRSSFRYDQFADMVKLIGRYDTALTNQMVKLMHEIERLRRLRAGEAVAPPLAADVSVELQAPPTPDSRETPPPAPLEEGPHDPGAKDE